MSWRCDDDSNTENTLRSAQMEELRLDWSFIFIFNFIYLIIFLWLEKNCKEKFTHTLRVSLFVSLIFISLRRWFSIADFSYTSASYHVQYQSVECFLLSHTLCVRSFVRSIVVVVVVVVVVCMQCASVCARSLVRFRVFDKSVYCMGLVCLYLYLFFFIYCVLFYRWQPLCLPLSPTLPQSPVYVPSLRCSGIVSFAGRDIDWERVNGVLYGACAFSTLQRFDYIVLSSSSS